MDIEEPPRVWLISSYDSQFPLSKKVLFNKASKVCAQPDAFGTESAKIIEAFRNGGHFTSKTVEVFVHQGEECRVSVLLRSLKRLVLKVVPNQDIEDSMDKSPSDQDTFPGKEYLLGPTCAYSPVGYFDHHKRVLYFIEGHSSKLVAMDLTTLLETIDTETQKIQEPPIRVICEQNLVYAYPFCDLHTMFIGLGSLGCKAYLISCTEKTPISELKITQADGTPAVKLTRIHQVKQAGFDHYALCSAKLDCGQRVKLIIRLSFSKDSAYFRVVYSQQVTDGLDAHAIMDFYLQPIPKDISLKQVHLLSLGSLSEPTKHLIAIKSSAFPITLDLSAPA